MEKILRKKMEMKNILTNKVKKKMKLLEVKKRLKKLKLREIKKPRPKLKKIFKKLKNDYLS